VDVGDPRAEQDLAGGTYTTADARDGIADNSTSSTTWQDLIAVLFLGCSCGRNKTVDWCNCRPVSVHVALPVAAVQDTTHDASMRGG
jgi:hypothetical protein